VGSKNYDTVFVVHSAAGFRLPASLSVILSMPSSPSPPHHTSHMKFSVHTKDVMGFILGRLALGAKNHSATHHCKLLVDKGVD
jgi:hypothetical protein